MKTLITILLVGLALAPFGAFAQQQGQQSDGQWQGNTPPPVGYRTEQWLKLQRSGREAAPPVPMAGEVAQRVYQRYLKSFTHPIPEHFQNRDSFSTSGSNGGR